MLWRRKKKKKARPMPVRKLNNKMKRKLAGLFVLIVLALICLVGRLTYISAVSGEKYARQVLSLSQRQYGNTILPYKRGDILDANGLTLATSEKRYNVILDCKAVNSSEDYKEPTIEALATFFDIKEDVILGKLMSDKTKNSMYQVLKKAVSVEEKQAFDNYKSPKDVSSITKEELEERGKIKGVSFEEIYVRIYPQKTLACDVIGFTNGDNTADWGIEGYYTNTLNGVDGRKYGHWNENDELTQTIIEPEDGHSVITTIDANIQKVVEDRIAKFEDMYNNGPYGSDGGAANVGVVIMNPNDGSILAMASSDPYDLNNPRDLTRFLDDEKIKEMSDTEKLEYLQKLWRNYCISDAYEPGSVFKPTVVSAGFQSGTLAGNEKFYCDGGQTVAGTYIKCAEEEGHGDEALLDIIRNSCNDGMMQIAEKMGMETFCKYQKLFNFGSRTGIDLSGEASGILYSPDTMGAVDLATSSFGQGFTCTMIQEAAAIASVINGGNYYQPRVVSRILDSDGSTIRDVEPTLMKQTISEEVSDTLRTYMKAAVDNGTCVYSKVSGYSMGGKSGTAQKLPRGNGKYLVSFIGFTPVENPQLLIYVVVDEPNVENQDDNRFPQWIAKDILTNILPYMNIYPDEAPTEMDEMLLEPERSTELPETPVVDAVADTNVPVPAETTGVSNENPNGGNNAQSDGFTNEDAGIEE
ncbi:MAG: penicillin-binding transpeptidase domain-containing protein [Lachnospiraceae bacterium]|nr:penicillin-binding transpeptidase domain-containing protein [Lachnospiraceae bacterium]